MNKRTIRFTVSAILFLMLACSAPVDALEKVVKESNPASSTASTVSILFEDDFSQSNSGWDRTRDEFLTTDYLDNRYQILINDTNFYGWANPGKVFSDTRVEATAELVSGAMDTEYGMICRYKDIGNFYVGLISADGYYAIIKNKDGKFALAGMEYMQDSPKINPGVSSNKLRFDCVGDTLTLYANGEILAEVKDSDFANGDVGLIASTYDTPHAEVLFDNFTVYRP